VREAAWILLGVTRPTRPTRRARTTWPRTGHPYLDEPRADGAVVAMAHRGGALHPDNVGLENTRHAFAGAVALGYRYLETDVHATADGQLLAFHDEVLDRVTDLTGVMSDRNYRQVVEARVGGREPIPRLADLLEEFPDARFNVDIKAMAAVEPLVDLVVGTGVQDRLCVGSFKEPVLRRFRRLVSARSPHPVPTASGVGAVTAMLLPRGQVLARLLRDSGSVLQVPHRHRGLRVVDRRFVNRAHRAGRHVHVWTVDDRAEMVHLLDLGVDGIITDRTDVLREVLVERGQWHWGATDDPTEGRL
jgi:glycerophosphoryl diester phosphodiesterase